jgi:hypothetical protein
MLAMKIPDMTITQPYQTYVRLEYVNHCRARNTEELGLGIKRCEIVLSSASAAIWDRKIKDAQRAHDVAQRFVHRFRISGYEAKRINHRIIHVKTLLEELK